jgi:hypothetical protein
MVLALAASAATGVACAGERDCTSQACVPSQYQLGSAAWPAGNYQIALAYEQAGPVAVTCSLGIGVASDGADDAGALEDEPIANCSGITRGHVSVCASDRTTLEMHDSPQSFQVTVRREGRVLFDETVTPDYHVAEINGPSCGECRVAVETIDVRAQ